MQNLFFFFFYPSDQLNVCGVDQTPCCQIDNVCVKPAFKCVFFFCWYISILLSMFYLLFNGLFFFIYIYFVHDLEHLHEHLFASRIFTAVQEINVITRHKWQCFKEVVTHFGRCAYPLSCGEIPLACLYGKYEAAVGELSLA